jgi:hypothetical protein
MIQEFTTALESIEATDKALAGLCRLLDNDEVETIRYYRNELEQMEKRIKAIMAHRESDLLRKLQHAARPIGYMVIKSDLSQVANCINTQDFDFACNEAARLADKKHGEFAVCRLKESTNMPGNLFYLVVGVDFLYFRNNGGRGELEYFTQSLRLARYSMLKDSEKNDVPYSLYEVVAIKMPNTVTV